MTDVFHGGLQRRVRLDPALRPVDPREPIPVVMPLGGFQSHIYQCENDRGRLFKVFKPDIRFPDAETKLSVLQLICKGIPGVTQIEDLLFDHAGGECVGYTMDEVANSWSLAKQKFKSLNERIHVATQLANACFRLQCKGAGPSDLHNHNILIDKHSRIYMIDVDSFFFKERNFNGSKIEHHLLLGTRAFTAPEIFGVPNPRHTNHSAAFSLAVNLYIILKDFHPASLRNQSGRTIAPEIVIDSENYGRFINEEKLEIIDEGIAWVDLPGNIRSMFTKTFFDSLKGSPDVRPLAEDWATALDEWKDGLRRVSVRARAKTAPSQPDPLVVGPGGCAAPAPPPIFHPTLQYGRRAVAAALISGVLLTYGINSLRALWTTEQPRRAQVEVVLTPEDIAALRQRRANAQNDLKNAKAEFYRVKNQGGTPWRRSL